MSDPYLLRCDYDGPDGWCDREGTERLEGRMLCPAHFEQAVWDHYEQERDRLAREEAA